MFGKVSAAGKVVTRTTRIDNARTDSAHNRFLVTERDDRNAEREAMSAEIAALRTDVGRIEALLRQNIH